MQYSKTNGLINSSTDYEMFKFKEDNRELCTNHVLKLKESIERHNDLYLNPIIVTEDMEIVDGQHRLEAAKILQLPIYYVIDSDYDSFKMINFNTTQRKWTPDDYLNYWLTHGNQDYVKLDNFMKDIGFPLTIMMRWVTPKTERSWQDFKIGSFKFVLHEDTLQAILSAKRMIDFLKSKNVKPIQMYHQRAFHDGAKKFLTNGLVDHARFFDRLENIPFQIRYSNSWIDYFEQFVEIYNFDMRKDRLNITKDGYKCYLKKG